MRVHAATARRTLATLGVALLLVATAALAAIAAETHDVEVVDDAFDPPTLEVTEGDTVRWTQTGSNPHTVTADDQSFDSHPECESFADDAEGRCMNEGDTFEHTFDEPGEYGYFCRIHGSPGAGMAATIVVTEADDPDPDPTPTPEPEEDDPVDDEDEPAEDEPEAAEELPETGTGMTLAILALGALLAGTAILAGRAALTARS